MNTDKIIEIISNMEDFKELMKIGKAFSKKHDELSKAAMNRVKQKFKMGTKLRIKDEKGEWHTGMFFTFKKKKVDIILYGKHVKLTPIQFELYEAEVVEE